MSEAEVYQIAFVCRKWCYQLSWKHKVSICILGRKKESTTEIAVNRYLNLKLQVCKYCMVGFSVIGVHRKKQEVSVPTEELLLTCNLTTSGMNSNLQLREYAKILCIQILQIDCHYWEPLNAWLAFVTVVTQKLGVKKNKQPGRTMQNESSCCWSTVYVSKGSLCGLWCVCLY